MYSSVPKLKAFSFVRASRARHRPSKDRDFFRVHPGLKCAAREGLDRSLKGTSGSPNTPPCAGGVKVPISPFGPYQGLCGPPKPGGTRGHRLSRAQGTRGGGSCAKGGAASALEFRWGTFRDKNVDFTLKTA